MSKSPINASPEPTSKIAVTIAFVLVCLNLRIVYGGVWPLLPDMKLDPIVVSALTAFPPFCMGLFAPLGAVFARRFGEERALFLLIALLTVGVLIRSCGLSGLLAGKTLVVAIASAVPSDILDEVRRIDAEKLFGVPVQTFARIDPTTRWIGMRLAEQGLDPDPENVGATLKGLMVD